MGIDHLVPCVNEAGHRAASNQGQPTETNRSASVFRLYALEWGERVLIFC